MIRYKVARINRWKRGFRTVDAACKYAEKIFSQIRASKNVDG